MLQTSQRFSDYRHFGQFAENFDLPVPTLRCDWQILRKQLLEQWTLITADELNDAGPDCRRIANLIAYKYGIIPSVVENYLRNFERTLPLL